MTRITPSFTSPITVGSIVTDAWSNDRSTSDTIDQMRQMTVEASKSDLIRSLANKCIAKSNRTDRDIIRCAFWMVKGSVTFAEDEEIANKALGISYDQMNTPEGSIDLLIHPQALLSMPVPMGDCDDYSMLLASILIALGYHVWFVTIAVDSNEPERWSHVYVLTYLPDEGKYIPLDSSHGGFPGWEKKDNVFRRQEWAIN